MTVPPPSSSSRFKLRLAALVIFVAVIAWWAASGRHTGWSRNQVPVTKTDEVTGIEYVEYQKRFVPGIDMIAVGAGLSSVLFAISFFIGKRKNI